MLAKMMLWGAFFALSGLLLSSYLLVIGCLMVIGGIIGLYISAFR